MDRVAVALLQLLCLAIAFTSGDASTKCYQCTTVSEAKCNDPFDKAGDLQPSECILEHLNQLGSKVSKVLGNIGLGGDTTVPADTQVSCMKMAYTDSAGDKHVVRSCQLPKTDAFDPCQLSDSSNKQSYCGICEGEACNGAGRLGGVKTLFYLLLPCLVALKAIAA